MKAAYIILLSATGLAAAVTYVTSGSDDVKSLFDARAHSEVAQMATVSSRDGGRTLSPANQTPAAPPSPQPEPSEKTRSDRLVTSATDGNTDVQGGQKSQTPQPGQTKEKPPAVDETALRYFARQGDTKRLQAEIARLKALYPGWTPPANPLAVPANGDRQLDEMWQLYAQGRYAEERKAIAERQKADPNWTPPKDLLQRLDIAEARRRLINASNLKQYDTVVRLGSANPSLLTCSDVDVLWRVAEAFAHTGRADRAKDAYSYILKNCSDPKERLATVEKAIPLLPENDVKELFALGHSGPDGKGEFEAARADLVRHDVSTVQNDPAKAASAEDLAQLKALAAQKGNGSDALLLGWYFLRHKDAQQAVTWFSKAAQDKDSAQAAQGQALAFLQIGKPADAENVVYKWRDTSSDIRKVYLAAVANLLAMRPMPVIAEPVLARMADAVAMAKDPAAAQQFGWYARALHQDQTAGRWFSEALRWKPDDEPSAYGLALTRSQLKDEAGVKALQRQWAARSPRIAQLGETQQRQRGQAGTKARQNRGALRETATGRPSHVVAQTAGREALVRRGACTKTMLYSSQAGAVAVARGWCLMDLDRPKEAVLAFDAGMHQASDATRREAAWGQSLAYLRIGLTDKAAVAAASEPQPATRRRLLQESILSQRASNFFNAGRYNEALLALDQRARIAPERLDLLTLRGYAYLKLRRFDDAYRVFKALAASGDQAGIKGMGDVRASVQAE